MAEIGNKITDYPISSTISNTDKVFSNVGGALKQVTKETLLAEINSGLTNYGLDNKFDGQLLQGRYYYVNGNYQTMNDWVCNTNKISCKSDDTITIKYGINTQEVLITFYNNDTFVSYITPVAGKYEFTFRIPQNSNKFAFSFKSSGVTPTNVGHVGVYINNAIDEIKADLDVLGSSAKQLVSVSSSGSVTLSDSVKNYRFVMLCCIKSDNTLVSTISPSILMASGYKLSLENGNASVVCADTNATITTSGFSSTRVYGIK